MFRKKTVNFYEYNHTDEIEHNSSAHNEKQQCETKILTAHNASELEISLFSSSFWFFLINCGWKKKLDIDFVSSSFQAILNIINNYFDAHKMKPLKKWPNT